jgi:release factor glutamine methyltransferase
MDNKEIDWLLKEKYNGEKSDAFFADCKRLALGEPLAYLIGFTPFLDCTIWLDSRPLIPRAETEFWVERAIETLQNGTTLSLGLTDKSIRVLDLCAGSGCIGIAIAKALPEAHVSFSEIDAAHIPTIKKNLKENGISPERYTIFQTSLFKDIPETFDVILCNPPYIDQSLNRTDESVVTNEPHLALYGGQEGMEIIKQLITETPNHLKSGGHLWIEHEPEQVVKIAIAAERNGFTSETFKDQYEVERVSVLHY